MAQQEEDREDLLREATALVRRIEVSANSCREPIFAGFRRNGSLSIYFGVDFVVQFNTAGEIRRGFADGCLLKAEAGQMVVLRRQRTRQETQLVRLTWDARATQRWLLQVEQRLSEFAMLLDSPSLQIRGQVPADSEILAELRTWLAQRGELRVAQAPSAG